MKKTFLMILSIFLVGCGIVSSVKDQFSEDHSFMFESLKENSPFYNDSPISNKIDISHLENAISLKDQYILLQDSLSVFQNLGHIELMSLDMIERDGNDYGNYFPSARNEATMKSYKEVFQNTDGEENINKESTSEDSIDQMRIDTNVGVNYLDDIAYLNIRSFNGTFLKPNTKKNLDFYATLQDYPYLIIDVRGNGGGNSGFATDLLVPYLIPKKISYTDTAYFSGERAYDYLKIQMKSKEFKAMHQIEKVNSEERAKVKAYFNHEDIYRLTQKVQATPDSKSVHYQGKIYVLMDNKCGSSTNVFLKHMRAAGATLVGQNTMVSGDTIFLNPMEIALPNSGFVIRMQVARAFDENGVPAEIVPDEFVQNRTDILERCKLIIKGN